jgi:uncharacterized membrane protein YccC
MLSRLTALAAWGTLAFICFVTLSPIDLRPKTGEVGLERFGAFVLLGVLFAAAYPSHFLRLILFLVCVVFGFEALQLLTPDRHGQPLDAIEKAAGALAGACLARFIQAFRSDRKQV